MYIISCNLPLLYRLSSAHPKKSELALTIMHDLTNLWPLDVLSHANRLYHEYTNLVYDFILLTPRSECYPVLNHRTFRKLAWYCYDEGISDTSLARLLRRNPNPNLQGYNRPKLENWLIGDYWLAGWLIWHQRDHSWMSGSRFRALQSIYNLYFATLGQKVTYNLKNDQNFTVQECNYNTKITFDSRMALLIQIE